jgi:hypothetical protein
MIAKLETKGLGEQMNVLADDEVSHWATCCSIFDWPMRWG